MSKFINKRGISLLLALCMVLTLLPVLSIPPRAEDPGPEVIEVSNIDEWLAATAITNSDPMTPSPASS